MSVSECFDSGFNVMFVLTVMYAGEFRSAAAEQGQPVPFICSLVVFSQWVGGTPVSHSGSYGSTGSGK